MATVELTFSPSSPKYGKFKNFEGDLTETAAKAATTVETIKNTETAKPHRNVLGKSQFWAVVAKARRTFDRQLDMSNDVKRRCLEHFISTVTIDSVKFWADYMDEVNILLDSRKFERECAELGVDKTNIATWTMSRRRKRKTTLKRQLSPVGKF